MPDVMTVAEAANALGTSQQTVRTLLRTGELPGRRMPRGTRHVWTVSAKGVAAFLSQYGRLDGRRRPRSRIARLEASVAQLLAGAAVVQRDERPAEVVRGERDALRAQVVALQEAFVHVRHAADLQRHADGERAVLVKHLLAATSAAERTDEFRRQAAAALDEAVA